MNAGLQFQPAAPRIAVLVDGDNLSAAHAPAIAACADAQGQIAVARVYGNVRNLPRWEAEPAFRLIHAGSGKNATDILLTIEAVELAHAARVDGFVLASSDGDFTHLARHLRERRFTVIGLGEAKAPAGFRCACTSFQELPQEPRVPEAGLQPVAEVLRGRATEFDRHIRAIIAAGSKGGRGVCITELSLEMRRQHDTRISTMPERRWRAYLLSKPALYDLDPRSPEARVRFLPAGFAAS